MRQTWAVTAALVLAIAASAHAAEYHVSPTGQDDNAGTAAAKPFKTIEHGLALLKPGDTLLIHEGRYGAFTVRDLQGTAEKPITIKAPEKERAVIDRYPQGGVHTIHLLGRCRYLVFENLEVTDSDPKIDEYRKLDLNKSEDAQAWKRIAAELEKDEKMRYRSGIRINPPGTPPPHDHLVFRRMVVHHLMGLGFTGRGDNFEFIDNHVYDLGYPASGYGWYMSGSNHVLRGNRVHDNSYGMHLYTETKNDGITNALVENNVVYNTGKMYFHASSQTVKSGGVGILLSAPGGNNVIRNNVLIDNNIGISLSSKDTLVANNTVVGGRKGILLPGSDKPVIRKNTVCNNIAFGQSAEALSVPENQENTIGHNLAGVNPRFVDMAGKDLHLQADSPAIDAGSNLKEVPVDIEGTARPQGKGWDIGAYEFKRGRADGMQTAPATMPSAPKG